MSNLTPPVFVIEGEDVSVYASVKEAEIDIEPIDAKSGGLVAYDAQGRLLRFETNHWRVSIALAEDEPRHADELECTLREFLRAVNDPSGTDPTCDLPCLVEASSRLARRTTDLKEVFQGMWRKIVGMFRDQE